MKQLQLFRNSPFLNRWHLYNNSNQFKFTAIPLVNGVKLIGVPKSMQTVIIDFELTKDEYKRFIEEKQLREVKP